MLEGGFDLLSWDGSFLETGRMIWTHQGVGLALGILIKVLCLIFLL